MIEVASIIHVKDREITPRDYRLFQSGGWFVIQAISTGQEFPVFVEFDKSYPVPRMLNIPKELVAGPVQEVLLGRASLAYSLHPQDDGHCRFPMYNMADEEVATDPIPDHLKPTHRALFFASFRAWTTKAQVKAPKGVKSTESEPSRTEQKVRKIRER